MSRDYYKSGVQYVKKDNEGGADLETLTLRSGLDITAGGIDLNGDSITVAAAAMGLPAEFNERSGSITLTGLNIPAGGNDGITIENDKIQANCIMLANIVNYTGAQGIPLLEIYVGPPDFILVFSNIHATNAIVGDITVHFLILDS